MSENSHGAGSQEVDTWIREKLDEAVEQLMELGIVTSPLVEARPVWTLPYKIMIGQVRDANQQTVFKWVISGEVPIDHLDSAVASSPREAARHFALKWQLDAARYQDPSVQKKLGLDQAQSWDQLGARLADKAEALIALVNDENLWQHYGHS